MLGNGQMMDRLRAWLTEEQGGLSGDRDTLQLARGGVADGGGASRWRTWRAGARRGAAAARAEVSAFGRGIPSARSHRRAPGGAIAAALRFHPHHQRARTAGAAGAGPT